MPTANKDRLRIAMLGHKRIPSREGGVEIVVEELSVRMAEQGHQLTCYNRKGHHVSGRQFDTGRLREYQGVRLKEVFTLRRGGLAAMTASAAASLKAALGRYDVVHFHAEGPCATLWLPKLFGKKCVATVHGLDHQRAKWGKFASWYIRFGEKCAVRFADEIIVLSQNVQQYFKEQYGRETVFIPNGVTRPEPVKAQDITREFGLEKDNYLLFLGRLVPEKGLRVLLEAVRRVNTDKKLVIAGGASDTDDFASELKRMAKEDDRVIFTGFVQGRMLEELYSNAYLYLLPSDLEGMPLSLLEAMSYGNCCLTSDIPECADVVGNCGFTFRRGDVADLALQMQTLCDRPEQVEEIRLKSADAVCHQYNWDEVVSKTLQRYGVTQEGEKEPLSEAETNESFAHQ